VATLATVATNHAATDGVCSANLPAYVLAGPTSTAPGIAFSDARQTLAVAKPTRATAALIYISTGSTLAGTRPRSNPAIASPKS